VNPPTSSKKDADSRPPQGQDPRKIESCSGRGTETTFRGILSGKAE
jgi:hypothetical protein